MSRYVRSAVIDHRGGTHRLRLAIHGQGGAADVHANSASGSANGDLLGIVIPVSPGAQGIGKIPDRNQSAPGVGIDVRCGVHINSGCLVVDEILVHSNHERGAVIPAGQSRDGRSSE